MKLMCGSIVNRVIFSHPYMSTSLLDWIHGAFFPLFCMAHSLTVIDSLDFEYAQPSILLYFEHDFYGPALQRDHVTAVSRVRNLCCKFVAHVIFARIK